MAKKPIAKTASAAKAIMEKSAGKLAYEQQRAAKAGKSHEEWLREKAKAEAAEAKKAAPKPVKKPGFLSKLIDKAHRPLGK